MGDTGLARAMQERMQQGDLEGVRNTWELLREKCNKDGCAAGVCGRAGAGHAGGEAGLHQRAAAQSEIKQLLYQHTGCTRVGLKQHAANTHTTAVTPAITAPPYSSVSGNRDELCSGPWIPSCIKPPQKMTKMAITKAMQLAKHTASAEHVQAQAQRGTTHGRGGGGYASRHTRHSGPSSRIL